METTKHSCERNGEHTGAQVLSGLDKVLDRSLYFVIYISE